MIMHLFSGIASLLENIGFAVMAVLEGVVAVISFLPTMIENLLFSLELFILGLVSCVDLIFSGIGYVFMFLIDLPNNIGWITLIAANGVEVLVSWIVLFMEFILSGILFGINSIGNLFQNGFAYSTKWISTLGSMVTCPNTKFITDSLSHTSRSIRGLGGSLVDGFMGIVGLPFKLVRSMLHLLKEFVNIPFLVAKSLWNFLCQVVSGILSLTFGACNDVWRTLVGFLGKVWTTLWPFPSESVYLRGPQDVRMGDTAGSLGWLARFSQLMLWFAVIILIAVLLTILYHMRHKILATLVYVATTAIGKLKSVFIRERHARNVDDNGRGARQPLNVRNNEDGEEEIRGGEGPAIPGGDIADHNTVLRNHRMLHGGGESSQSLRAVERRASPTPQLPNYQKLLQQERDKQLCVVCQDQEKDTLLLPCKHLCVCSDCVDHITNAVDLDRRRCPLCRNKITAYVDVFT